MPKFCTKCGNKLGDGDLFCGNCGAPVANTNEQRLKTIMPREIPTTQKEEEDKERVETTTQEKQTTQIIQRDNHINVQENAAIRFIKSHKIISVILFLIVISIFKSCATGPDYRMNTDSLAYEFSYNANSALAKYRGKKIRLSVRDMATDVSAITGHPTLMVYNATVNRKDVGIVVTMRDANDLDRFLNMSNPKVITGLLETCSMDGNIMYIGLSHGEI